MSLWKNATAGTKSSSKAPTLNDTRPGGQVWSLHVPVQPLPERLRPSELALFVGQSHLAERLTTLLEGPRLPSLLLFGPPGCGKSTLALLLARARGGNVLRLSAPEAGLQQLRRQLTGVDILVLDELHRFSKAQQTSSSRCWSPAISP